MRKAFLITTILLMIAILSSAPIKSQTAETNLSIRARWDSGGAVQGVVTLSQVSPTGLESILVTKSLSKGSASFQTSLVGTAVYDVTLSSSDGTQLVKFPLTTALINPANLQQAGLALVFNSSNKSLKSANVSVDLAF
jgi:hypothetical protein